jgi:hypothetical protein
LLKAVLEQNSSRSGNSYERSFLLFSYLVFDRSDLACQIALDATATVALEENGRREIDIKRYAKVEKVSHGSFSSNL